MGQLSAGIAHELNNPLATIAANSEFAGELLVGGGECEFRARTDQVRHGLGLREVNASVQKGAPREFAGFGQARAIFEQRVQD